MGKWTYNNSEVRRQDRLLNESRALEILETGEYGVLAMVEDTGLPYAVPLNYVYVGDGVIYIHCAPEGRKLRAIAAHSDVAFVVVGATCVQPSKFTTEYESIIVRGRASVGLTEDERRQALHSFLAKYSPEDMETGMKYASKSFFRTEIIRLNIATVSGKAKQLR